MPTAPISPATELTMITRPPRWRRIIGSAPLVTRTAPQKSVSTM